jgi:hypothetical protein
MANHAYVKTKKKMTPDLVSQVIENLNQRVFKGLITTTHTKNEKNLWRSSFYENEIHWLSRVCWLNSPKSFELRHGGTDFEWWWDTVLANEIAVVFDGTIIDDGDGEKWAGVANKYDDPKNYLELIISPEGTLIPVEKDLKRRMLFQYRLEMFPAQFHFDYGGKVDVEYKEGVGLVVSEPNVQI